MTVIASSVKPCKMRASEGDSTAKVASEDRRLSSPTFLGSGLRSWVIIVALSVVALLPALEGTVVSTALPTIVDDLHGGKQYVWVVNSYFLTRYAPSITALQELQVHSTKLITGTNKYRIPTTLWTDCQHIWPSRFAD